MIGGDDNSSAEISCPDHRKVLANLSVAGSTSLMCDFTLCLSRVIVIEFPLLKTLVDFQFLIDINIILSSVHCGGTNEIPHGL